MGQRHGLCNTLGIAFAIGALTFTISSCIDELYDLNNGISSEMALGGDSLAIPIGSTDTIRLSDFLSEDDVEMLKTMEDGGYGLSMNDSIDVDVPEINQDALQIDKKTFTKTQTVNFGDINLENFSIPGVKVSNEVNLSLSAIKIDNFNVPAISETKEFKAGMSDYALENPTIDNMQVNTGQNDLLNGITLPNGSGISPPIPLPVPGTSRNFDASNNLAYSIDVPDGVSGINQIDLADNPKAVFKVSIELAGASDALAAGQIVPNINISPSDLFVFSQPLTGGVITFGEADSLTVNNNFKKTKTLYIDAFNITETPSNGKLNISKVIQANGGMNIQNVKAWSDKLSEIYGMDLKVSVSIENVVIESMDFNIPTLHTNISGSTTFNINNSIPADIKKINKVIFNDPGTISFDIQALNLPTMINKTIKIDQLQITFPNEFVFEPQTGLSGQTYTLTNFEYTPGSVKKIQLNLKQLDMTGVNITGGNLTWNDQISYTGSVSFAGRINSKNIPTSANDTKMSMNVSSSLGFNSAEVVTNEISKALPVVPVKFTFDVNIADMVKSLGVINLTPGTMINIKIDKPSLPLALSANNIQIEFPSIFTFKPALLMNTYTINGEIPNNIQLELAALNINKDLDNGKLTLTDSLKIFGGIKLASGTVNSKEIEAIGGKKMSLEASTSALTISSTTVQLKTLNANFTDTTTLNIAINDLPEEIISLDSIMLENNATLDLAVDITNLPQLSHNPTANMIIKFPDMLQFVSGEVDSYNRLHINQEIVGGKLNKTVHLKSLHFDGNPLNGKLSINEEVPFDVQVSVQEPTVNSAELTGKDISVKVDVTLDGLKFKSVFGNINPGIEPVTTTVELSDLPEFMKGEDVVLDVTKPVIALEALSNLGIPIDATINLKPMRKGSELSQGKQTITIKLPKSSSASINKIANFWIAPDSVGMPKNYQWIPSDIQNMFKTVPDKIDFVVNATANPDEEHFIDLNADYKMKVKYEVTIPMAFGKDLMIEIRDTIADLDESIGDIAFSGHGLEVFGSIYNSIPLELDLTLIPLDADNKPINVTPASQLINAGAHDGSATATNLSMKFSDPNGLLKNIRGFDMKFKASSNETVAGTPIRPDNFVKAELKVRLNGGIKIGDK